MPTFVTKPTPTPTPVAQDFALQNVFSCVWFAVVGVCEFCGRQHVHQVPEERLADQVIVFEVPPVCDPNKRYVLVQGGHLHQWMKDHGPANDI